MDDHLREFGAQTILPMGEGDELSGQDESFRGWAKDVFKVTVLNSVNTHIDTSAQENKSRSTDKTQGAACFESKEFLPPWKILLNKLFYSIRNQYLIGCSSHVEGFDLKIAGSLLYPDIQ